MSVRRSRWTRWQRRLLLATAGASALVLAVTGGLSLFFGHLNGNIATQSMGVLGRLPPPSKAGVPNILALGSQTRDGQGPGFGRDPGTDLSDTAMLIHLNASHTRAIVLSIPRDLLVYRPPCRERVGDSAIVPGQRDAMFDSAMNLGGPACAVATVQDMSGVRIDHFIRVDFNGFRTMTDALGGVQVCVPAPGIHDWRSHLNISAGLHVISGSQALAFVRDRHGIGNGGDLGRILAESLRALKLGHIAFVTVSNEFDPSNVDRLVAAEPAASAVWRLLREDLPWTGRLPGAAPAARTTRTVTGHAPRMQPAVPATPAAAKPKPSSSVPGPGVQTRNAGANICSGLPAPNNLGELGG